MMFTCPKCGRKLKTLHERVYKQAKDKEHNVARYEPSGYHCQTCRIFYDASTKQASKVVYGVARKKELGVQSTTSAQVLHRTHANAAQNACEIEQECMQKLQNAGDIERERTLDHLCVRQVS